MTSSTGSTCTRSSGAKCCTIQAFMSWSAAMISARLREDPHAAAAGVGGGHRCRGSQRSLVHLRVRGDQEEPQLLAEGCEARELLRHAVHLDPGIERCADGAGVAQLFQLTRDVGA